MKKYFNLIIFSLIAAVFTQCGEPEYPTPTPIVTTLSSRLTVVHALVNGPRLKIKIDNKITEKDTLRYEAANDGKFYNAITLTVPAGPTRLINYANFADNADLLVDRYAATSATNNTAFFINAAGTTNKKVRRIVDDLTLPDPGLAKVRFLNFGYNVPEIKVVDVATATTTFSARKYDEVSRGSGASLVDFTRFTTLPAGNYTFEVQATSDNSVLLTTNSIKLDSKGIYTIYLKGLVNGVDDEALSYAVIKH